MVTGKVPYEVCRQVFIQIPIIHEYSRLPNGNQYFIAMPLGTTQIQTCQRFLQEAQFSEGAGKSGGCDKSAGNQISVTDKKCISKDITTYILDRLFYFFKSPDFPQNILGDKTINYILSGRNITGF
jgi:hypothetical protein